MMDMIDMMDMMDTTDMMDMMDMMDMTCSEIRYWGVTSRALTMAVALLRWRNILVGIAVVRNRRRKACFARNNS